MTPLKTRNSDLRCYQLKITGQLDDDFVSSFCRPDLIILDLGLPDIDGVEITRRLREWSQTPVIILSVREQEADKISALDAGADDYLTKPFSSGELMARIRVAIRRSSMPEGEPVLQVGDLQIDLSRHIVFGG